VELSIYDITGGKIRTLVNRQMPAGFHQVVWQGRDDSGSSVASGVYLYRIRAGQFQQSRKMVLLR
jgi:flagellar hook assembly protein FlgD